MSDLEQPLAIYIPSMAGGGAERVALNLAEGMVDRGYSVDLVLAQADGPYLAEVPDAVRIIDLESSRVLPSLPGLVSYLRRERPRVLLSEIGHANVVALWARRLAGVPRRVVVCHHSISRHSGDQRRLHWRERLMPGFTRRFYPWADGIVAVSEGLADDLAQVMGIPRERITASTTPSSRRSCGKRPEPPRTIPGSRPVSHR